MMTKIQASRVLSSVVRGKEKWGKEAKFPYTMDQIVSAVQVLLPEMDKQCQEQLISQEELTLLKRQYTACKNRETGRQKREGKASHTVANEEGEENGNS